ncbi:hypothetical protein [Alicyclobacillus ferrooxydans]|uniref:Uncharacterized protein n=1 Tax=Alicyclobacillus ferrooxydans TaxID=471514 RepID=A0A0P9GTL3_9BACL|nr:hypothetical protein [Alicyclobacillus ferrooxydans]KPV44529.1 hypothetical protein AN477_05830 [Alicyclobacillus ferrooxydans]
MKIHHVSIDLSIDDLNSMIREFAPDAKIRILSIDADGIRGQVKLLWWSVDFLAIPLNGSDGTVSVDISASKLVPIPSSIVERQLKEAVRSAPSGVDVIQQALKVHLPSILSPFGIALTIKDLSTDRGLLHISINSIDLPSFRQLTSMMKQ